MLIVNFWPGLACEHTCMKRCSKQQHRGLYSVWKHQHHRVDDDDDGDDDDDDDDLFSLLFDISSRFVLYNNVLTIFN